MKRGYLPLALALLLSAFCTPPAWADPANPRPFPITQPDGSVVTLVLHGDEYGHWTTDAQGRVMERGADGFYRPTGEPASAIGERMAARARQKRQERFPAAAFQKPKVVTGGLKGLVVLVDFRDKRMTVENPQQAFSDLLNQPGYTNNGAIGSAADYYYQNSYGAFLPSFDVKGPVTLDKSAYDFPEDDEPEHFTFAVQSFLEALTLLDQDLDFSLYDQDGDGYVDNLHFIYAGEAQSSGGGPDTIWPHSWGFYPNKKFDGVKVSVYACSSEVVMNYSTKKPEMCGIGTICHEFGHTLGLPDVYDTDYKENGQSLHPGKYSLMASGCHNNDGRIPANLTAFEKSLLGWMDIPRLEEGAISLPDLGTHPAAGYIPTDTDGEWFVFETRDGKGWDTSLSPGLLVMHLDRSQTLVEGTSAAKRWETGSGINAFAYHPCYVPVFPVPDSHDDFTFPGQAGVTGHVFTGWSGNNTGFRMREISFEHSVSNFNLEIFCRILTGTVRDQDGTPLQDVTVMAGVAPEARAAQQKGLRLRPARIQASRALGTARTTADGRYYLALESTENGFELYAEKDNYLPATQTIYFNGVPKLSVDLELRQYVVPGDPTLQKHNGELYGSFGIGEQNESAAVRFNADELADYAGMLLGSVDLFFPNCNGADAIHILVDVGPERLVYYPVDLTTFHFGGWTRVDLSALAFRIPAGKDLHIGFAITNPDPDSPYPFSVDTGPLKDGGCCIADKAQATAHEWYEEEVDFNLMLGVNLTAPSHVDDTITLLDLGISYIAPLPSQILAGDALSLSLVESPSNKPSRVDWYCDGEPCSTLITALAGTHTLQAVLHFQDGHTDTVETRFSCN